MEEKLKRTTDETISFILILIGIGNIVAAFFLPTIVKVAIVLFEVLP